MKKIYLLCGIPGSGKSTWAKNHLDNNSIWISRDLIRFSMVSEGEEYFSKEKEVFKEFIRQINVAIKNNNIENIYIDATHINEVSRHKTLSKIAIKDADELNIVYFNTPLKTCISRNANRFGRECVPEIAIINMYKNFNHPKKDTKYTYSNIYEIGEQNK